MNDMRQLFDTARGDLPPAPFTVDEITERGRRSRRRRSMVRGLAAAGAAVAVAAVAVVGIPHLQGSAKPATPGAGIAPAATKVKPNAVVVPPFTYTIKGFTAGGFRVEAPVEVTLGYESARVVRDKPVDDVKATSGLLTVYRAGAFDESEFKSGTPATVAGRPGLHRTFPKTVQVADPKAARSATTKPKMVNKTIQVPALAWEYADDSWATLTADSDDKYHGMTAAQVQAVAAKAVLPAKGVPATMPYSIGSVPAGWKLASVGSTSTLFDTGDGEVSHVYLARQGVRFTGVTGRIDLDEGPGAGILLTVQRKGHEGPYPHPFKGCMDGESGLGAFCDLAIPNSDYYVEVHDTSKSLTPAQVGTITNSLEFADPTRKSTWIPATK
jgi:hypothetical protein